MTKLKAKVHRKPPKKINSPFGYFGSKNKIALQLCNKLPPHNCWVEAFCGSATLTLRKHAAPIEVINDLDGEIVNLFKQLRINSEKLYALIELTPYAEEELSTARKSRKRITDLERARRFLVQSMMAVNGVFGETAGGFSYSDSYSRNGNDARVNRWNKLPDRLIPVVERLKSVRIERKDAKSLLRRYLKRPATLMYLDPPYFADRTNGYNREANDENFHTELLQLANKAKCMIFISGYENDLYSSLLTAKRGWKVKKIKTHTQGVDGETYKRTEVVWMNKYFIDALEKNVVPITLTKKEKKDGKINPERSR